MIPGSKPFEELPECDMGQAHPNISGAKVPRRLESFRKPRKAAIKNSGRSSWSSASHPENTPADVGDYRASGASLRRTSSALRKALGTLDFCDGSRSAPSARRDIARSFASISRGCYSNMVKLDLSARQSRTAELDGTQRTAVAGIDGNTATRSI